MAPKSKIPTNRYDEEPRCRSEAVVPELRSHGIIVLRVTRPPRDMLAAFNKHDPHWTAAGTAQKRATQDEQFCGFP